LRLDTAAPQKLLMDKTALNTRKNYANTRRLRRFGKFGRQYILDHPEMGDRLHISSAKKPRDAPMKKRLCPASVSKELL
jgi:hypothetical protein